MTSLPGEEAQVDFFQGPPTLDGRSGQWRRPWIFRMTLCHSRHGYEEAVWDQKLESFLALHERAFRDLGGVPRIVRHDNLKAAVVRACLYDPDVNPVYEAFSKHWGFTGLPTRPRNPEENGKQERSGGYVKDNALKGRRFDSLDQLNAFLRHWNRTVARVRIHGTTRRQVFTHYEDTDKGALQSLATESFALFQCGTRTVHTDGHVEVSGAFYPVPLHLLGVDVQVRWDARLIRVFHEEAMVAVHAPVREGEFAPRGGGSPGPSSSQRAYMTKLLAQCARVGPELRAKLAELAAARFVATNEDVLLIGPPGVGKSHIATAIALGAIRAGYRVLVRSAFDLAQDFLEAEALQQRKQLVARLTKIDLLVIEDFGMKRLGPNAAEDLLEVFVRRHEGGSTLVTTNRPTQDWGVFLGDIPAATAILDRFLSHADLVQMQGKSYRMHQRSLRQSSRADAGA
jgi:hypothetical protein